MNVNRRMRKVSAEMAVLPWCSCGSVYLYAILREKWGTRLRPLQPRFLQAETNLPYNCAPYCKSAREKFLPRYLNLERRFHLRLYADVLTYSDAMRKKKKKERKTDVSIFRLWYIYLHTTFRGMFVCILLACDECGSSLTMYTHRIMRFKKKSIE